MKAFGKLIKDSKIIKESFIEHDDSKGSYNELLERCLVDSCKALDISVPLWLSNNTSEFVANRKTTFARDHFVEDIKFDKFELLIE